MQIDFRNIRAGELSRFNRYVDTRMGIAASFTVKRYNRCLDFFCLALVGAAEGKNKTRDGYDITIFPGKKRLILDLTRNGPPIVPGKDFNIRYQLRDQGQFLAIYNEQTYTLKELFMPQAGVGLKNIAISAPHSDRGQTWETLNWQVDSKVVIDQEGGTKGFDLSMHPDSIGRVLQGEFQSCVNCFESYRNVKVVTCGFGSLTLPASNGSGDWIFIRENAYPVPVSDRSLGIWDQSLFRSRGGDRLEVTVREPASIRKTVFQWRGQDSGKLCVTSFDMTRQSFPSVWNQRSRAIVSSEKGAKVREFPFESNRSISSTGFTFAEDDPRTRPALISA